MKKPMETLPAKQVSQSEQAQRPSALAIMAGRLSVEPAKLFETLKATVFKGASNEELLALTVVANEYRLNPLLKEMYAFPSKGGGIVPVVGVDGWIKIVNRQSQYDGVSFEWQFADDGKPEACTCTMKVKERSGDVIVTEFFDECYRNTDPWNKMPKRMLRHKAFMQAARLAFGLSGVYDEDEAKDIATTVTSYPIARTPIAMPEPLPDNPELEPEPKSKPEPEPEPPVSPTQSLANLLEDNHVSFDDFRDFITVKGFVKDASAFGSCDDVPVDVCAKVLAARTAAELVKKFGAKAV